MVGGSAAASALEPRKELAAIAATKLGLADQLTAVLEANPRAVNTADAEGRLPIHYAAGYCLEDCLEVLLAQPEADLTKADTPAGDTPLHFAASSGFALCAYNIITKDLPHACLIGNRRGQTPIDVAVVCERGEVLNAMLLGCAGCAKGQHEKKSLEALGHLLAAGAVPDTWAPNGSSALMLAASVDSVDAVNLLLGNGATIELQDALGRSTLMFAAGNGACRALGALLEAGASLATRDRRGRAALEYAGDATPARRILQDRLAALEATAAKLQAALLASLEEEEEAAGAKAKKKAKKGKRSKRNGLAADALPSGGDPPPVVPEDAALEEAEASAEAPPPAGTGSASGAGVAPEQLVSAQERPMAVLPGGGQPMVAHGADTSGTGGAGCDTEWQVVGKPARKAGPKHQAPAPHVAAPPADAPAPAAAVAAAGGRPAPYKRCPSATSLTESTCSAESRDTDVSMATSVSLAGAAASPQPSTPHRPLAAAVGHYPRSALTHSAALPPAKATPLATGAPKPGGAAGPPPPPPPARSAEAGTPVRMTWASKVATHKAPSGPGLLALSPPVPPPPPPPRSLAGKPAATPPGSVAATSTPEPGSPSSDADSSRLALSSPCATSPSATPPPPAPTPAPLPLPAAPYSEGGPLVAGLRAEVATLKSQLRDLVAAHQAELACVLQDAARHEALAMEEVVLRERQAFGVRFLSMCRHLGLGPLQQTRPSPSATVPAPGIPPPPPAHARTKWTPPALAPARPPQPPPLPRSPAKSHVPALTPFACAGPPLPAAGLAIGTGHTMLRAAGPPAAPFGVAPASPACAARPSAAAPLRSHSSGPGRGGFGTPRGTANFTSAASLPGGTLASALGSRLAAGWGALDLGQGRSGDRLVGDVAGDAAQQPFSLFGGSHSLLEEFSSARAGTAFLVPAKSDGEDLGRPTTPDGHQPRLAYAGVE